MIRSAMCVAVCTALSLGLGCSGEPDAGCVGDGVITPICGFLPPEDLDVLPAGDALVVGGFSLDNENGDLRILRLSDHKITQIYPPDTATELSGEEPWGDPHCPGPPSDGFAAHGIDLSPNAHGTATLLVVNHTGREAIEWFEITGGDGEYRAAWRGCVIVDEPYWVNDIAMLPESAGGGFVASHMMPREIAATLFDRPMDDGVASGFNLHWAPESGWTKIEGTEGALPNGVQVSPDGSVLYSNHYLDNQVVAYRRETGERLWTTEIDGAPDNLSIAPDGSLLLSAHRVSLRRVRDDCMLKSEPVCGLAFAVYRIDPASGSATLVLESEGPPFGGSTVAAQAGEYIYLGAFAGDRIGRIDAPAGPAAN